jgi:hypothetical protein
VLDWQLLGKFDVVGSHQIMPLTAIRQAESARMLDWFGKQIDEELSAPARGDSALVFVVQHVPISRKGGFPPDAMPYWTVQEPHRSRELELLQRLGVKQVFAGQWHSGTVCQGDGITYHLAPATSWTAFKVPLGFALYTISPSGDVRSS